MGLAGEYGAALKELGYSLEARGARAARLLPHSIACAASPCFARVACGVC